MKPENFEILRTFLKETYDRARNAYAMARNQNYRAFCDGECCAASEALHLIEKLEKNEAKN